MAASAPSEKAIVRAENRVSTASASFLTMTACNRLDPLGRRGAAILLGLAAVGCSSYRDAPPPPAEQALTSDCGTVAPGDGSGDAPAPTYPAGPYATQASQVGSTLEDLSLHGYADSTAAAAGTATDTTLGAFYDPDGKSAIKLIFLNVAALWCAPCKAETTVLLSPTNNLAEKYKDRIAIVQVVFEGNTNNIASNDTDLATWAGQFSTPYWVVNSSHEKIVALFGTDPPYSVILDPRTMKVLTFHHGKPDDLEGLLTENLPK
jgi:thiol-disulfide isomerase/thioredoxin